MTYTEDPYNNSPVALDFICHQLAKAHCSQLGLDSGNGLLSFLGGWQLQQLTGRSIIGE
jgi:hypothetical protein